MVYLGTLLTAFWKRCCLEPDQLIETLRAEKDCPRRLQRFMGPILTGIQALLGPIPSGNQSLPDPPTLRPSDPPTLRPSDPPTLRPSDPPTLRPSDPPTLRPSAAHGARFGASSSGSGAGSAGLVAPSSAMTSLARSPTSDRRVVGSMAMAQTKARRWQLGRNETKDSNFRPPVSCHVSGRKGTL